MTACPSCVALTAELRSSRELWALAQSELSELAERVQVAETSNAELGAAFKLARAQADGRATPRNLLACLTQLGTTPDGGIVVCPEGWAQVQAALAALG